MAYTSTYTTADISSMVIDFIGGILAALAQAASPIIWAIVAMIVVGLISSIIYAVKNLGR